MKKQEQRVIIIIESNLALQKKNFFFFPFVLVVENLRNFFFGKLIENFSFAFIKSEWRMTWISK